MRANALFGLAAAVALSMPLAAGSRATAAKDAEALVAQLSWDSVDYDHMVMILWPKAVGPAAEQLIELGKVATPELLKALQDPDRAVAAHLVLCRIWFPRKLWSGEEPLYREDEVIGLRYHVRGLVWEINGDDDPQVDLSSVSQAVEGWCRKIPKRYRTEQCERAG